MRKHLSWILHLFIICVSLSLAGGPGEEMPPVLEETDDNGWVYGRIEYEHDLIAPNLFFIELLAHPDGQVPMIEGGYASTDVHVIVRLRGCGCAARDACTRGTAPSASLAGSGT